MRTRGIAVVSSGLAWLAGCSVLVSVDDLRAVDASLDATADAVDELSPADATVLDAGDAGDAGDAEALDGGASDASFCPTAADGGTVFCDDFDESDASTFPEWSGVVASGGGAVSRVASDASAPFCVELAMGAGDAGPQSELYEVFVLTPTQSMKLACRMRVLEYPSNGGAINVDQLRFTGDAKTGATDFLSLRPTSATFTEQFYDAGVYTTTPHALQTTLGASSWHDVEVDWDLGDGGIVATVYFDHVAVSSALKLDARTAFGTPTLYVGMSYEDPGAGGSTVDVDDVVFAFQ